MPLFPATGMPDADWWRALWPEPDATLRALGLRAGDRLVDLGCGDGWFTAAAARIVAPAPLMAVDIDPVMVAAARAACAAYGHCAVLEADALAIDQWLPYPADVALIANTFHGVPDPIALARSVHAVLAPGGRLVVINWHARPREETPVLGLPRGPATALRMTPQACRAAVEPAGLVLDRLVELPPYHYGALFLRADPAADR